MLENWHLSSFYWRFILVSGIVLLIGGALVLAILEAQLAGVGLVAGIVIGLSGILVPAWIQRRSEYREHIQGCYLNSDGQLPRVKELHDLRELGVYPVDSGRALPQYIRRDFDLLLRSRMEQSGFILLVGGSISGKSRSALEAVKATVPGHTLIAPGERAPLSGILERAMRMPKCVLWLDNLELYLRPDGLRVQDVRRFLTGHRHHRLIIATMTQREIIGKTRDEESRRSSRYTLVTLELAHQIYVGSSFSEAECGLARLIPDSLIADALEHAAGRHIPEYMVGAADLVSRLSQARRDSGHERGAALVYAAIDCCRAGLLPPIPRALIEEVYQDYLTGTYASDTLPEAWEWAMARDGTASLLEAPAPSQIEPGEPDAVMVFAYLLDQPYAARLPDRIFRACLRYANSTESARIGRIAYRDGKYLVAYAAYLQSTVIRAERAATDSATLASRDNYARVLRSLGMLNEAEGEHRATLKIREQLLIAIHDGSQTELIDQETLENDILINRDNLGRVLRAQNKLDLAQEEHESVLAIRLRKAPTSPAVLLTRMYLAEIKSARGLHEIALAELTEILKMHISILETAAEERREKGVEGDATDVQDNADVLILRNYIAVELRLLRRPADALAELADVVSRRQRTLGPEHPDTLISRCNLALVLSDLGRYPEAAQEHEAVLAQRKVVLGESHPYTEDCEKHLADAIQMLRTAAG